MTPFAATGRAVASIRRARAIPAMLAFCVAAFAGCTRSSPHAPAAGDADAAGEHAGVTDAPSHGSASGFGDSAAAAEALATYERTLTATPGALSTVTSAPVVGWTGPGGRPFDVALRTREQRSGHTRRFGTVALPTALRGSAPDLGSYPCTSCHFGRRVEMADDRIGDAHQNIQPVHPARLGSVCSTCHAPDNVERLALRDGDRPVLDHAYRLCAQCHFAQVDAWAVGAHGKRLDGWQGRRVMMGCADCHNPHRPALVPRTPFRAPTIERARGHRP